MICKTEISSGNSVVWKVNFVMIVTVLVVMATNLFSRLEVSSSLARDSGGNFLYIKFYPFANIRLYLFLFHHFFATNKYYSSSDFIKEI